MSCSGCAARRAALIAAAGKTVVTAKIAIVKATQLPADVAAMAARFATIKRR